MLAKYTKLLLPLQEAEYSVPSVPGLRHFCIGPMKFPSDVEPCDALSMYHFHYCIHTLVLCLARNIYTSGQNVSFVVGCVRLCCQRFRNVYLKKRAIMVDIPFAEPFGGTTSGWQGSLD